MCRVEKGGGRGSGAGGREGEEVGQVTNMRGEPQEQWVSGATAGRRDAPNRCLFRGGGGGTKSCCLLMSLGNPSVPRPEQGGAERQRDREKDRVSGAV